MDLTQVLQNANNPNEHIRNEAERWLATFEQTNFAAYAQALANELGNAQKDPLVRKMGGLLLKNLLSSHEEIRFEQFSQRWMLVDPNIRNSIKTIVVHTLADPNEHGRHTAAQVVAAISHIELPQNSWNELIPLLLSQMNQSEYLKHSTLECLGYIAEGIESSVLESQSNEILTAVCRGIRDQNVAIKLAGLTALYNSLEFCRNNFAKENERNYIMQVICEASVFSDPQVRASAIECLVQIASLYYEILAPYIQTIFNITIESIQNGPNEVALQGVEFWSTICDEEIYLIQEAEEAQEEGRAPEKQCSFFIRGALKYLVPRLLDALTKQDDEPEQDTWNVATAAGSCLVLISQTVEDEVISHVMPFVTQYINHQDWKFREAAVLAFGSILEGPKNLTQLISQAMQTLLERMKDSNPYVKDTTAWTLGKICQHHTLSLSQFLPSVVRALGEGLDETPRIAANCCWGLHNIAVAYERDLHNPTSLLSQFFTPCLEKLVQVSTRKDVDEGNLRTAAYEAINGFISSCAKDMLEIVQKALPVFMSQLNSSFTLQDIEEQIEIQSLLCSVLQTITNKLEHLIQPFAKDLMELYIRVFNVKSSTVHEEALMAVGALINAIGAEFEMFLNMFKPYLLAGLKNSQECEVCTIAVSTVGDLARALGPKLSFCSDDIVEILLQALQNQYLSRDVKPPILSCFGDIALAISGNFVKYLHLVMTMLQQASNTQVDPNDPELIDYLNSLRESIFDAYTGIIQGLRSEKKEGALKNYLESLCVFLNAVAQDKHRSDGVTRGAIGVIGDLVIALGIDAKIVLRIQGLESLLETGVRSENQNTVQVAKWARENLTKLAQLPQQQ